MGKATHEQVNLMLRLYEERREPKLRDALVNAGSTDLEQWMVWEQVKPVLGAWRTMFGNQKLFANMEEQCKRLEAWREKNSPGSNEATRKMRAEMLQAAQAAKAQAAGA